MLSRFPYLTPMIGGGYYQAAPDPRATAATPPHKRPKAPVIVGALLAVAVIVLIALFVLIPVFAPKGPGAGALASKTFSTGTLDLSTDAYAPVKLQVSTDSVTVEAGYPFDIRGTLPIKSKADQGDVTVYDLDFSGMKTSLDADSGEVWNQEFESFSVVSFQVFVPTAATYEKPFGTWGFVLKYTDGSDLPVVTSFQFAYKEGGSAQINYSHGANGSLDAGNTLATSFDQLAYADPLSDAYNPSLLNKSGKSTAESASTDCTWSGDANSSTLSGTVGDQAQTWTLTISE